MAQNESHFPTSEGKPNSPLTNAAPCTGDTWDWSCFPPDTDAYLGNLETKLLWVWRALGVAFITTLQAVSIHSFPSVSPDAKTFLKEKWEAKLSAPTEPDSCIHCFLPTCLSYSGFSKYRVDVTTTCLLGWLLHDKIELILRNLSYSK